MSTTPVNLTSGLASAAATASPSPSSTSPASSTNSLANENIFLQLLVAQLKNQDPSNPADGTQFVTQLAQFTSLQEETQSAGDLNTIVNLLQTPPSPATAPAVPKT
jgi:flagellar basal-body rod modification protein FlgD